MTSYTDVEFIRTNGTITVEEIQNQSLYAPNNIYIYKNKNNSYFYLGKYKNTGAKQIASSDGSYYNHSIIFDNGTNSIECENCTYYEVVIIEDKTGTHDRFLLLNQKDLFKINHFLDENNTKVSVTDNNGQHLIFDTSKKKFIEEVYQPSTTGKKTLISRVFGYGGKRTRRRRKTTKRKRTNRYSRRRR
jgi:hypothetical protein